MGPSNPTIVFLGAGEMASGAIRALYLAGLRRLLACEVAQPLAVRRAVSFAEAVVSGRCTVEGIAGRRIAAVAEAAGAWEAGEVPVLVDPCGKRAVEALAPLDVLVDARVAKRNLGVRRRDARLVVGLGPGFVAGDDVHLAVETCRGHDLGRVIRSGPTLANTGVPGAIAGETLRRVVRAPAAGRWRVCRAIGDRVEEGELLGRVDGHDVRAAAGGVLRGLLPDGFDAVRGAKLADVDPRGRRDACFSASDKARLVGAGVLEAVLSRFGVQGAEPPSPPGG